MRIQLLIWFLGLLANQAQAQIEEYYEEKKNRKKVPLVLGQADIQRANNSWYVGLEGGGKWNGTKLGNSLSGVLQTENYLNTYWAVQFGYEHNQRWAVESGYVRNPVSGYLFVVGQRTLRYLWQDLQITIPLRFKWRLFKIGTVQKVSGLYVGGGLLFSPGRRSGQSIGGFQVTGLTRIANTRPAQFDTLLFVNNTYLTGRGKIEYETSVEFVGRVSKSFEIVTFVRATLAGGSIFQSDTQLIVNQQIQARSALTINPFSYQFGMSFRYLYQSRNVYRSRFDE